MEVKIVYFEKEGEENTDVVLALAKKRAGELGIKNIVVASTKGNTAVKAVNVFSGFNVVAVTHVFGGREPNTAEFLEENRKLVESKGGKILTTAHAFGGINQALQSTGRMPPPGAGLQPAGGTPQSQRAGAPGGGPPAGGVPPARSGTGDIIASTLGIFGRGMKVACEISAMAADAGLVRCDEDIIAIAGTHAGADVAVVLQPANAHRFFDTRIKEIICKPRT